jgi:RND family efflux transporter MFP subunit
MKSELHNPPAWQRFSRTTLVALASAIAMISACTKQAAPAAVAPIVMTSRVALGSTDTANIYSGEVHARFETPLSFRVPGRLTKRYVHLGDEVKNGAVLAEIDPADANASQRAIEAQLRSAKNRLQLALQTNNRNSAEAKEDLVARNELEQSQANLAIAKADVDQLHAQLDLAQNQSKYTRLIAEQDGLITSENAEEGAVLAAGQAVFGFAVAGERDVTIDVAEDRIDSVKIGQSAEVALSSNPGVAYTALIREVAKAADPQSRTFRVKLSMVNPDAVMPGLTATVKLASSSNNQFVTIPASALFHKGSDTAVWVVDPKTKTLQLHPVDVASYRRDQVVLAHGLANGDEIVTNGVNTVTAGMVVRTAAETKNGAAL